MKRLFKYLRPYLLFTIIAPLFMIVEVWMDILSPMFMSSIIDEGIAAGDMNHILWTSLKMIGVALIGVAGGVGNMYFSTKAGYGFAKNLRAAVYEKIQAFSFANVDEFKTGSLITRTTNDVAQIQNAFTTCIRMLVRSPFLCIGGVIAVLGISPKLSLVVFCAMPFIGLVVFFALKKAFPRFKGMQEKLDRVNVVMQENLAGVRVIKAFGRSEYEKKRFCEANNDLTETSMRAMRLMSIGHPLIGLVMNITMVCMYWIGGQMVFEGTLSPGNIMAFANYITQILMALTSSSFMLIFISRAQVSFVRVNEVLDTKIDIVDGRDTNAKVEEGCVEFKNVYFRYPGDSGDALKDISFSAKAGETVAILGATGSGKSSLVHLIPRLYDVRQGQVLVDGKDVRSYTLENLRGSIGVALQESVLFTGSIDENLHWGDENAEDDFIRRAADVAQAAPFVEAMEEGYNTELGQRGVNLSGGQKQRLCIARALIKKPKILILDDSTSAVDLATEAKIQTGLREMMGHLTVFIIAQRISSVRDADKIIVLDEGRIVDIGKHNELINRCEIYREIAESQLGKGAV
ncbi:MAG: ABC transporter ATP-binding protein [Clostridiales bacterium]|nr:ABC transporter ATP-binding protein [Clostridiales bacterium]